MEFDAVAEAVHGIPFMTPDQGRIVYDHVRAARPREALELGTAHGVSAAYMAAAMEANGFGQLVTVDHGDAAYDPPPESVLARAGLRHRVSIVRAHSTYTWWLKEEVQARSDAAGNCQPRFDFVYLDGAKNFTIDGLAVVLIEKLLRPGAWLLMDDLDYTWADHHPWVHIDASTQAEFSPAERTEPHLRAVFELIVKQHPSFTDLRIQDEWWAWARKAPGEPRRLVLETSKPLPVLIASALRRRWGLRTKRL
ncbi:MAG TPA: class I SAM-dependent methyltransferase [Solirubrobacteraceae bacterium]|nr:class I SAM-dependent methyltransferase [Solirubrobacteraceae bacterium]